MREQPLFCPSCGYLLSRVSKRDDYFCRRCHSAVAIVDDEYALVQSDLKTSETMVKLDELRAPRGTTEP